MPFYASVRSQDNKLLKEFRSTTPEIVKKKFSGQFLRPTFKITSVAWSPNFCRQTPNWLRHRFGIIFYDFQLKKKSPFFPIFFRQSAERTGPSRELEKFDHYFSQLPIEQIDISRNMQFTIKILVDDRVKFHTLNRGSINLLKYQKIKVRCFVRKANYFHTLFFKQFWCRIY
jgi:hypothetical protein